MKIRSKVLYINLAVVAAIVTFLAYIAPLLLDGRNENGWRIFTVVLFVAAAASIFTRLFIVDRLIMRRVDDLTKRVDHIKDYRSFYDELQYRGNDEVSGLAKAINSMTQRIVSSNNEVNALHAKLQHENDDTNAGAPEQSELEASVNNLSLGFIMTDTEGSILLINNRAKDILASSDFEGETPQKWTLKDISDRFGAAFDLPSKLANNLRDRRTAEYADVAYGERILRIIISPMLQSSDSSLGSVIVLEDITEQKILERTRDEFFSIASHELRTPLTAIRGNTAMIKQFYEPQLDDKTFHEMVDDIHTSSIRLIGIVNDFLDASRLEQGKIKMKFEDFDLTPILETVAYETASIARDKGNHIVIDKTLQSMPKIYGDKDRVKQVVYNLVGNAMKFTEGGTIKVTGKRDGDLLKVLVSDTGPGIPEAEQKMLFRKFQQTGNNPFTRDTSRGTGLGLYISKLLVERMGGTIALEHSELGKGSTFSFTVPLAK